MRSRDEWSRQKGRRVVLVGTGTDVGKTHVACALLSVWSERAAVVGLKPVETGIVPAIGADRSRGTRPVREGWPVEAAWATPTSTAAGDSTHGRRPGPESRPRGGEVSDQALLGAAGRRFHVKRSDVTGVSDQERLAMAVRMFHVKLSAPRAPNRRRLPAAAPHPLRSLFLFAEPVSPHLAARDAGTRIDIGRIERWVRDHEAPVTVIETAGGLFSPLGHGATNFELMQALRPDAVILVASDRLGVLHELTTTIALAAARGGPALGVVLSAPAKKDASTGRNAAELAALGIAHPVVVFPRAPVHAAATADVARRLVAWVEQSDVERTSPAASRGQLAVGVPARARSSRSRPRSR